MSIFAGFRVKRTEKEQEKLDFQSKDLVQVTLPTRRDRDIVPQFFHIHNDINGLIWYADGKLKNIDLSKFKKSFTYEGITIEYCVSGMEEPSMIFTKQPIEFTDNLDAVDPPPYYPTYHELTPVQKGIYIRLLENPYRTDLNIGYVFLLYYGLERHLLTGDWQQAVKVILKLREYHKQKSFQTYSASALILTAIIREQGEIALATISSLGSDFLPVTEYFLCASSFNLHITSRELMYYAEWLGFHNTRYIKNNTELFSNVLTDLIYVQYNRDYVLISDILTDNDIRQMNVHKIKVFANTSLIDTKIEVPYLSENEKLRNFVCNLLQETHDFVKKHLAEQRKACKQI